MSVWPLPGQRRRRSPPGAILRGRCIVRQRHLTFNQHSSHLSFSYISYAVRRHGLGSTKELERSGLGIRLRQYLGTWIRAVGRAGRQRFRLMDAMARAVGMMSFRPRRGRRWEEEGHQRDTDAGVGRDARFRLGPSRNERQTATSASPPLSSFSLSFIKYAFALTLCL